MDSETEKAVKAYGRETAEAIQRQGGDPNEVYEFLRGHVQETMNMEQWQDLAPRLSRLEVGEGILWCLSYFNFPKDQGEFEKAIIERIKENGVTPMTNALNLNHTGYAEESIIKNVSERMLKSEPTEKFCLTHDDDYEIQAFWMKEKDGVNGVPSDLLLSKNISVPDCEIEIDETDSAPDGICGVCRYRVCIFKDYEKLVDCVNAGGKGSIVGAVEIHGYLPNDADIVVPIQVTCKGDLILITPPYVKQEDSMSKEDFTDNIQLGTIAGLIGGLLSTWYGIQFSLYAGIPVKSEKI